MEDWEQFFVEKSRRRAAEERKRARVQIHTTFVLLGLIAAAVVAVLILNR